MKMSIIKKTTMFRAHEIKMILQKESFKSFLLISQFCPIRCNYGVCQCDIRPLPSTYRGCAGSPPSRTPPGGCQTAPTPGPVGAPPTAPCSSARGMTSLNHDSCSAGLTSQHIQFSYSRTIICFVLYLFNSNLKKD